MKHKRYDGFTLVEVLIVVAIMGILINVGTPSFKDYLAKKQVQKASRYVAASLNLARSEAVKRNAAVYLVPEAGGNWANGWAVTSDVTKSYSSCAVNPDDCYLVQKPLDKVSIANTPALVTYTGGGRLTAGSSANFDICADTAAHNQLATVEVTASGRPKTTNTVGGCQ